MLLAGRAGKAGILLVGRVSARTACLRWLAERALRVRADRAAGSAVPAVAADVGVEEAAGAVASDVVVVAGRRIATCSSAIESIGDAASSSRVAYFIRSEIRC